MEKTKNRLRKYRAWTGERMIFRNLHDRNWYSEPFAGKICDVAMPHDIFYCQIMDFTGFKDYEDNEIYEGDVFVYQYTLDPTQKRTKVVSYDIEVGAWYLGGDLLSTVLVEQNDDEWKNSQNYKVNKNQYLKIIGNIHENPELIKK